MQRLFKFTKLKLIAGFVILLLLAGGVIVFIYNQTLILVEKDPNETITQKKLFLISNTLAKLYEAEGINPILSQTDLRKHFHTYLAIMNEVKNNMDTLKKLATSETQELRINTVMQLLDKKRQNLKALMHTKQIYMPEDFYNKAIAKLETLQDSINEEQPIRKSIIIRDTSYVKKEQKGFWRKLFSRKDSTQQITAYHIDSTITHTNNTDTLVSAIKEAWNEFQIEKEQLASELYWKEIAVIQDGQKISEQIKRMLSDLESEEITNTISRLEQQQEITRHLTRTLAWIAIIACILATVFVFLIISDISQSQRYRKALETAKAFTDKLLENREKLMLTVTHDIKSPLGSIIGYIELLANTALKERQRYFLRNMKGSAEHILHLANNMLDFSKLESNKMKVDSLTYNLARLLKETADSFLPLAHQKGLAFKSNISNKLNSDYQGDPMKIRQIVMNLISNAIKYTREGNVEIAAFSNENTPSILTVVVKDSGPGMTPEEQELIFKEFIRLDARHNNGAEGTGLGLTITRQLVQLLEGKLFLESKKGFGSTFTVKIPVTKVLVQKMVDTRETEQQPDILPNDIPLKILLVDDDPLQLAMCTELLSRKGVDCASCNNPFHALDMLEKETYQLVMTDIQMPEMEGFEFLRQIRQSPREKINRLPVIALSAREDIPESHYVENGFSAYLSKPFTSGQLFALIKRLTGHSCQTSPEQTETTPTPQLYDLSMIRVFADNDRETVVQILRSFISDCRTNFGLLDRYARQEETDKISNLAHKMLPMFKQLSIHHIIPFLLFLERMSIPDTSAEKIKETVACILRKGEELLLRLEQETRQPEKGLGL